jgi:hypothetical protein
MVTFDRCQPIFLADECRSFVERAPYAARRAIIRL